LRWADVRQRRTATTHGNDETQSTTHEERGRTMLDARMEEALNRQINAEIYSGYLYLSMAAQFAELGMSGGQNWMTVQYQEELSHAQKIFDYVNERGGRVTLAPIEGPQTEWQAGLQMFEDAYGHEQKVTALINDLATLALELKDHATHNFLQWFIAEQVEEEATASDMVQKFTMAGEHPAGLYQLDKELAARVFTPPAVQA
jgi:ferritin